MHKLIKEAHYEKQNASVHSLLSEYKMYLASYFLIIIFKASEAWKILVLLKRKYLSRLLCQLM